jgi:hypothetical protein
MHLSIYPEERFLKIPRTQKLETTASKWIINVYDTFSVHLDI